MRKIKTSGSGLFLLELMISIVFFALAAAGCVQIFAKAHTMSMQAEKMDLAVSIAQSLAEESSTGKAENHILYYDEQGERCEVEQAAFQVEMTVQKKEQMRQIQIRITDASKSADDKQDVQEKDEIYKLETAVYCPEAADMTTEETGGRQ